MIRTTKYLVLAIFVSFCSQQADPVNEENETSEEVITTQVELIKDSENVLHFPFETMEKKINGKSNHSKPRC